MAKGSPLYSKIQAIIQEVLDEMQQSTPNTDPEFGSVVGLNNDGTVNVQTSSGSTYQNVGMATQMTVGTQVVVITADGTKVAIPKGTQLPY